MSVDPYLMQIIYLFRCTVPCAGIDNKLMGWDQATLKEVSKGKLDSKANTTCMAASCRGFVAGGTPTLMVGAGGGRGEGRHHAVSLESQGSI